MDGTVIIADDDRTIRTVLTQAFTRAGCRGAVDREILPRYGVGWKKVRVMSLFRM